MTISGCLGKDRENALVKYVQRFEKAGFPPTSKSIRQRSVVLRRIIFLICLTETQKWRIMTSCSCSWYGILNLDCARHKVYLLHVGWECVSNMQTTTSPCCQRFFSKTASRQTPESYSAWINVICKWPGKPSKVVANKGSRNVHRIPAGEKGETITLIACCNEEEEEWIRRWNATWFPNDDEWNICVRDNSRVYVLAEKSFRTTEGTRKCSWLRFRKWHHTAVCSKRHSTVFAAPIPVFLQAIDDILAASCEQLDTQEPKSQDNKTSIR